MTDIVSKQKRSQMMSRVRSKIQPQKKLFEAGFTKRASDSDCIEKTYLENLILFFPSIKRRYLSMAVFSITMRDANWLTFRKLELNGG